MKILVINCGSSSLKYQLIDMQDELVLAKGICDRIGLPLSTLKHTIKQDPPTVIKKDFPNHIVAIGEVLSTLTHQTLGVLNSLDEITAIGHRGGARRRNLQKFGCH
jgi:acetate kinase